MGGGGWATCDTPVGVDDGYVAANVCEAVVAAEDGAVGGLPASLVALTIRDVADGLGLLSEVNDKVSDSDVDIESSPLRARVGRRLGVLGKGSARPRVDTSVVLVPAVPVLPATGGGHFHEGTVSDSVDGGELVFGDGLCADNNGDLDDPAGGGGSRAGGCECSCKEEFGYLNGKVQRLEDMVRLLIASAGLTRWKETQRVEKLKRKMLVERGEAERVHAKRVGAERAAGEERKKLAKRDEQVRKVEEVRRSQTQAPRVRSK